MPLNVISNRIIEPRRVMIYGPPNIGKTTFCASAPKPLLIDTEGGSNDMEVDRLQTESTWDGVMSSLRQVYQEVHDYKTLAIDTVDWVQTMIYQDLCAKHSKTSIADFGFGKGYEMAVDYWRKLWDACTAIRKKHGMTIILSAHADIQKFQRPDGDAFDFWAPRMHKKAWHMLTEGCDEVLFANNRVRTREDGNGKLKAVGAERMLWCTDKPTHIAKNRLGMPDTIDFSWSEYAKYIDGANNE